MKLQFRKSFYTRTLYAGNFNTILMGILIGLQKSSFTHCETLYPGNMYPHKKNGFNILMESKKQTSETIKKLQSKRIKEVGKSRRGQQIS